MRALSFWCSRSLLQPCSRRCCSAAAVITAVLDPILIFGLRLGLTGAAVSNVVARIALAVVGLYGVARVNHLVGRPRIGRSWRDVKPVLPKLVIGGDDDALLLLPHDEGYPA